MMEKNVIILKNISKKFKVNTIVDPEKPSFYIKSVDNVSLSIEKGKMIGIVGKKGSGKTTLLRIIAGVFVSYEGILEMSVKIGLLLQIVCMTNEEITVNENIILNGLLLGFKKDSITKKIPSILKFAELKNYGGIKMKYLSSGMKVRIMFSTALQIDPDILLVDEVLSVGDISFRQKSFDEFMSFKKRGKTIIFVSHNLSAVEKLCDEVFVMENGQVIKSGKSREMIQFYKERYEI